MSNIEERLRIFPARGGYIVYGENRRSPIGAIVKTDAGRYEFCPYVYGAWPEWWIKDLAKFMAEINPDNEPTLTSNIPYGYWDMDGHWTYNPNLLASPEEQFRHNISGGHEMKFKEDKL